MLVFPMLKYYVLLVRRLVISGLLARAWVSVLVFASQMLLNGLAERMENTNNQANQGQPHHDRGEMAAAFSFVVLDCTSICKRFYYDVMAVFMPSDGLNFFFF